MGGSIRTRIAVILLLLLATSAAATCYVIALDAQATVEASTRSRLLVTARFLRHDVEQSIRLGTPMRGPGGLQTMLESAVARDPDLSMVALLGRNGEILATAGRVEAKLLAAWVAQPDRPAPSEPGIVETEDNLVVRTGISSSFHSRLGELIAATPRNDLSPDVERLIILLLRGGLLLVIALAPVVLLAIWLILYPAIRSIGWIAGDLDAMQLRHGSERMQAKPHRRHRGDPFWDIPDPSEVAGGRLAAVDSFRAARAALLRADDALRGRDRQVSRLDTIGAEALPDRSGKATGRTQ